MPGTLYLDLFVYVWRYRAYYQSSGYVVMGDISAEAGQAVESELERSVSHMHSRAWKCSSDLSTEPNLWNATWQSGRISWRCSVKPSSSRPLETSTLLWPMLVWPSLKTRFLHLKVWTSHHYQTKEHKLTCITASEEPQKPALKMLDVNLNGVLYTAKLALFYFRRQFSKDPSKNPQTSLVLQSSLAGFMDFPSLVEYNTSKFAVRGLMRSLRRTECRFGTRVNLLAPWYIPSFFYTLSRCQPTNN